MSEEAIPGLVIAVVAIASDDPGITREEMVTQLGMNEQAVTAAIEKALELGLLVERENGLDEPAE